METNFIVNLAGIYRDNEVLKGLFDSLKFSIWFRNIEDDSFWVSQEGAKVYGYKQSELENNIQLWKGCVFLEDIPIVEQHIKQLLLGKPSTIDYRIIRSGGVVRWIQETANSLKDEQGKVVLNTSIVFDITDYKTAALHLAQREKHYHHLIELSPSSIFLYQEETIVYANSAAVKSLGADHKNGLVGKTLQDVFLSEEADELENQLKKIIKGEKSFVKERTIKTWKGKAIYIEPNPAAVSFKGKPAVMLTGIEKIETIQPSMVDSNLNNIDPLDLNQSFTSCNGDYEKTAQNSHEDLLNKGYFNNLIITEEKDQTNDCFELEKARLPHQFNASNYQKDPSLIHQDISKQEEIEKTMKYEDFYDYLTGLPNRSGLHSWLSDEITRASKEKKSFAVLLLNLDRFKVVNDTLDHNIGDLLLKEVTIRLKASIHENDIIFRQSGDEFIIILRDADRPVASKVAKRILNAFAAPYMIKTHNIPTSASIGISLYKENEQTAEELIKQANFAMYQAKKAGKNTYEFYFSNESDFKLNPLKMEIDLCKAIEQEELSLYYQPKVNLKTGNIVGFEALLRWKHPDWGMLSPASFIPFAEETGLIIPIGKWALYHACKQNKLWHQKGFSTVVAVNLSVRQLEHSDIVGTIENILRETGLEPCYLELEITGSIATDAEYILPTLQQFKNLGVKISIDDFGTKFSSFNYLKQFPVDTLKIDQSFIRELHNSPDEEAIVENIILMGHSLKLNVTAGGIETEEQLIFLQQQLCEEGQGNFFSAPLPAKEIEKTFQEVQQLVKKHGIPHDVNERMWAQELLKRTQKEMEETIRLHQGMIFKFKKLNDRFIHTLCDGELLYQLGLVPSQVVGKELQDFMPVKTAIEILNSYRLAWEEEKIVTYESMSNNVSYLTVLCPVMKGGKVVEVIGSGVDITARKQVEEALRESEIQYRLIADNMTDLICLLDRSGEVIYTSPSHGTVLGFPQEEFGGYKTLAKIHPEDIEFFKEGVSQIIQLKAPSQMEFRFLHADGNWLLIECVGTPVIGEDGAVEHVIMVGRDVTEKRKAEEMLLKSEKLTVVGELAAGIAHEIRNPLTSIKGFVQLMEQGIMKEEFFEVIMEEFNRVEGIIKEFLTLAKPQEIQLRKININKVLQDVETLLRSEAYLQNVQIHHLKEHAIPPFMCDANQIKQVFINLIKNSIEAMPDGGKVKIQALVEGSNVLIKISDNGMGIAEERLQKLGEPFFSNKERGTGLGLMLCFRIIRQHKGTIVFKSKENEGTTVEVRLPLS